ncbi:hypothetical protein HYZ80_02105 [Candidatus Parcubacteria bacterium]|nr:hypothetical protein [Candidatus Parcubacteria bacterium]
MMRNHFEQPHGGTPSNPEPATPEPIVEQRAETREQIIEHARAGRRNLLKEIFTSRTADLIGNFLPGIDVPKMIGEALRGETVSGEKLSSRHRFDHFAIAGATSLAYALEFAGLPAEAIAARAAAAVLSKVEYGPEFLAETARLAAERFPKTAHLLDRTATVAMRQRERFAGIGASVRAAFEKHMPAAA